MGIARIARASLCRSLAAAALVASGAKQSSAQSTTDLETVRVALSSGTSSLPALYAMREGLFRKAGLDVTTVPGATSGAVVTAGLLGGAIDIGMSNLFPIVEAHARAVPLVLAAPAAVHLRSAPDSGLLVGADSSIRAIRDLTGKTIAVAGLKALDSIGTANLIDVNGGDSRSVRFVEMPFPAIIAAVEQGRVEAGSSVEPLISQAVHSGKARFFADFVGSIAPRVLESGFVTTLDFLGKHRNVVERFAAVIHDAATYANTHEDQLVGLVAGYTGIDAQVIAGATPSVFGTTLDLREIQPVIDLAAKYTVIPKSFPAREMVGLA